MPGRLAHAGIAALAALAALAVWSGHAAALDRLDFRIAGGDAAVADAIGAASLVRDLKAREQTDPLDVLAAARADYGRILGALYALGHYSPVISILVDGREAAALAQLDAPARISRIVIRVDPGPRFRFAGTRIGPLATATLLPDGFRTGQPAESGLIGAAVDAAITGWRELGHARAGVGAEAVVADHRARTLDVAVAIAPGPKLRFGELAVEGEARMREARVRKIAGLPTGEVFSARALRRLEERLRRTGIFSSVALAEDAEVTAPDLLGLTATVVEHKPRRLSFGAELASLDGLALTGSWLHRNLLGGGERFQISGSVSNIGAGTSGTDYLASLTLDRPATLSPDTTAGLLLTYEHRDEIDYAIDRVEFGLGFTHVFSEGLTARTRLTYSFQEGRDPGGAFTFRNLTLPTGVIWDRRDNARDPKRGTYLDASVMPFLGFASTESGLRAMFDGRHYRSFGAETGVVLALRLQGGAVLGPGLLETPRDLLFYSGGAGTVRGQPYRSLGLRVSRETGPEFQIGGPYFLGGSIELRADVTERIGLVGFVDAGSIGLDGFLDGAVDPHAGAGLGLRYDTGLGPIRLDVAAPIAGATGDGVQFHIGLGQAF